MIETRNIQVSLLEGNEGQIDGLPANPRIITEERKGKLRKSIDDDPEMLEIRELVVVPYGEKYVVIMGNKRLGVVREKGWEEVPCKVLPADTPAEKLQAYTIKDNIPYGEWDLGMIDTDWDVIKLQEWGLDLDFTTPFEEDADGNEGVVGNDDDFEVPEDVEGIKTSIVLGDLIEIGEHRLLCGDSTDSDQVAKLMNGEKADMVVTDPPYNVNYGADKNHPSWNNKRGDRTIKNDKMSADDFAAFIQGAFASILPFCDGVIYCFGAQGKDGRIMFTVLDNMFHNSATIIWLKDRMVLGRGKYHTKYEPCWFGWNKDGSTFTDDRTLTNVWECKRPTKSELHPTMKPIELLEMPLLHNPSCTSVLDIFLGSGSTMVAAHGLNRKCYGMELEPKYCQVIVDRMLNLNPTLKLRRNGEAWDGK